MYSVLLDNVFLKHDFIDLYVNKENGLSTRRVFPAERSCLDLLRKSESLNSINFKSVVKLVNHLLHVNDYNNLSLLLDLAYDRKYLDFCDLFYSPLHNKNFSPSLIHNDSPILMNLLDNMVFVIDNKELFINSIKERGYNVNEGPKR
jgi:hypothetical protein